MFMKWLQIVLYVTTNTPVPTGKDLWKPATPGMHHHASGTNMSLGAAGYEMNGVKQHLAQPYDLSQDHAHSVPWTDLNKPNVLGAPPSRPENTEGKTPQAAPDKQKLKAAPRHELKSDKDLHTYSVRFEGKIADADGHPARATAILKIETPHTNQTHKAQSNSSGHYVIEFPVQGIDNENLLWWIYSETPDSRAPEKEGSRIFSHDTPTITLENDLTLAHI
jgi:hypothetical protein